MGSETTNYDNNRTCAFVEMFIQKLQTVLSKSGLVEISKREGMPCSEYLRQARKQIGKHNDLYLQIGITLVWNDDDLDTVPLFPHSIGNAFGDHLSEGKKQKREPDNKRLRTEMILYLIEMKKDLSSNVDKELDKIYTALSRYSQITKLTWLNKLVQAGSKLMNDSLQAETTSVSLGAIQNAQPNYQNGLYLVLSGEASIEVKPNFAPDEKTLIDLISKFAKQKHNLKWFKEQLRFGERLISIQNMIDENTESSPSDENTDTLTVDGQARRQRDAIWADALRELSVSQDSLVIFLRNVAGNMHESVEAIIDLEDRRMEAEQRLRTERRLESIREASTLSRQVVGQLLSSLFKSDSIMLGGLRTVREGSNSSSSGTAAGRDPEQLLVLNTEIVDKVSKLLSQNSSANFFEVNNRLKCLAGNSQGEPIELSTLVDQVRAIVNTHLNAELNKIDSIQLEDTTGAMAYLQRPPNSLLIRLKNETFAAIRQSYAMLETEMRCKGFWRYMPTAYECIEGSSRALCTEFAALTAYHHSASRLYSSRSSMYVSVNASRANSIAMRISLQKLVKRALEFKMGRG